MGLVLVEVDTDGISPEAAGLDGAWHDDMCGERLDKGEIGSIGVCY